MANELKQDITDPQVRKRFIVNRFSGLDGVVQGKKLGPEMLEAIHAHLTQDVDKEPGKYRDDRIPNYLTKMEDRLEGIDRDTATDHDILKEITQTFVDVARVNPFQTENTLVARRFLSEVAQRNGHDIAWDKMNPGEWKESVKAARDGNNEPAEKMMRKIAAPGMGVSHGFGQPITGMKGGRNDGGGNAGKPNPDFAKKMADKIKKENSAKNESTLGYGS